MTDDVALAYLRFESVTGNFVDSLFDLLVYDRMARNLGDVFRMHVQSMGVVDGANAIAQTFLDSDAEYLFWLDCDMGFAPDTLHKLRSVVDPAKFPAVSALTFKFQHTHTDGLNGYLAEEQPVIMDWVEIDDGEGTALRCRKSYPENALVRCDAVGMACVLIHRSVHEKIHEKFGPVWHSPIAFGEGAPTSGQIDPDVLRAMRRPGKTLGPDLSFWTRAAFCDVPIHVHTGVPTNHQKSVWLSPASYAARHGEQVHGVTDLSKVGMVGGALAPHKPKAPNRAERRRQARA